MEEELERFREMLYLMYGRPKGEDYYERDSFSDRFFDDICEEILQYLPLKDKIRLQCVSKQFQRTIFRRQYELRLEFKSGRLGLEGFPSLNLLIIEDMDLLRLRVLEKCPQIKSLYISSESERRLVFDDYGQQMASDPQNQRFSLYHWLYVIIESLNLQKISSDIPFSENYLNQLIDAFGHSLRSFKAIRQYLTPNQLNRLENCHLLEFEDPFCENIMEVRLPRLTMLKTVFNDGCEYDAINNWITFVNNNGGINHISLSLNYSQLSLVLKELSKLKNLIHFELKPQISYDFFCEILNKIGGNSTRLKSLSFHMWIRIKANTTLDQLLAPLKKFRQLKRLGLTLDFTEGKHLLSETEDNYVRGLENITDLSLRFAWYPSEFSNFILISMIANMVKLQNLEIHDEIRPTPELFKLLSSLKHLKSVEIHHNRLISNKKFNNELNNYRDHYRDNI